MALRCAPQGQDTSENTDSRRTSLRSGFGPPAQTLVEAAVSAGHTRGYRQRPHAPINRQGQQLRPGGDLRMRRRGLRPTPTMRARPRYYW
jgi:hypothetical protein